jgi:catechol-2,3-dioxygenase
VNEHVALALDRANFEQAQRDLDALGIPYELWDHGICDSLYFDDPEGHQIELTTYHDRPRAAASRRRVGRGLPYASCGGQRMRG